MLTTVSQFFNATLKTKRRINFGLTAQIVVHTCASHVNMSFINVAMHVYKPTSAAIFRIVTQ